MNIKQAVNTLEPLITNIDQQEALATLCLLAMERDEALRQAQEDHDKLEALREALKGLKQ